MISKTAYKTLDTKELSESNGISIDISNSSSFDFYDAPVLGLPKAQSYTDNSIISQSFSKLEPVTSSISTENATEAESVFSTLLDYADGLIPFIF